MTTETLHIRYDAARSLLLFDEELLDQLAYPDAFRIEARADGLLLTGWQIGLEVDGFVGEVVDGNEEITEMHILIDAEQAGLLGLRPGVYSAWTERLDDRIFAVPERTEPTAPPADLVAVTIALTVREVQLLEQLALGHGVRMIDILTGFGADLSAAYAPRLERFQMRSGGSDERLFAEQWFERNLAPVGDEGERSEFARRFSRDEEAA